MTIASLKTQVEKPQNFNSISPGYDCVSTRWSLKLSHLQARTRNFSTQISDPLSITLTTPKASFRCLLPANSTTVGTSPLTFSHPLNFSFKSSFSHFFRKPLTRLTRRVPWIFPPPFCWWWLCLRARFDVVFPTHVRLRRRRRHGSEWLSSSTPTKGSTERDHRARERERACVCVCMWLRWMATKIFSRAPT